MRADLQVIASLISENTRVFDIGCGEGTLLHDLATTKHVDARGIELESERVSVCLAKGLSVVQGDADTDLINYPDNSFDYVILGQSLQATKHPRNVLEQGLRIGKQIIISIPNFGHWSNRLYLFLQGRMPVTKQLPYEWYNTPNIHFCTIRDFVVLIKELNCNIVSKHYLNKKGAAIAFNGNATIANLFGTHGIFVLSK